MRRSRVVVGMTTTMLVLPWGVMGSATATEIAPDGATEWTEWISDDGGSAGRELPAMSADGRYVVFIGRSEEYAGIWLKDRLSPAKPPVQVASGYLFNPDISADGSTVAWTLYGGGGSGGQAVYTLKWRDPAATPQLVSRGDDDEAADGVTDFPSLSGNGRYVAFQSMDMTLDEDAVPGPEGGNRLKAYVRDTVAGTTEMVSVMGTNTIPNGSGLKPDITPDGRYVAFASDATSLQEPAAPADEAEEPEEEVTYQQVYRRDRVAGTTVPVSVSSAGELGNGSSSIVGGPTISADGQRVAFESMATNLVAGDTNADIDAFVRDVPAGTTARVSLDEAGAQVDTDDTDDVEAGELPDDPETSDDESAAVDALPVGADPAISGDGLVVAYQSFGAMTADDLNGVADVYTYGMLLGGTDRQSVVDDPLDGWEDDPAVADDAFEATGTRADGHTGEIVPAVNGATPAVGFSGLAVAFVSQGNLTGRVVEEEGEETAAVSAEPEGSSIEPGVYLHRPNPEPDTTAPRSTAYSPDVDRTSPIRVTYTRSDVGFPRSGVAVVRLYVKKPGWTAFKLVQIDRAPALDGVFKVKAVKDGRYRFYTRARDVAGNLEAAPRVRDDVTIMR